MEHSRGIQNNLDENIPRNTQQENSDTKEQLKIREKIIKNYERLVSLLREAERTLQFFETQNNESGLLTENYLSGLRKLKELVDSLHEQIKNILEGYDVIMKNSNVDEKVREEAHEERIRRELKDRHKKATEYVTQKVIEIVNKLWSLSLSKKGAEDAIYFKEKEFDTVRDRLKIIIHGAVSEGSSKNKTVKFLEDLDTPNTYGDYITGVEAHGKNLGLFQFKEKKMVNFVLRQKHRFDEADKLKKECLEAKQCLEDIYNQVDTLAAEYKTLVSDAWVEENKMKREFPAKEYYTKCVDDGVLPEQVHWGIIHMLERQSGLGKVRNDNWIPPREDNRGENGSRRKELEKFTGPFSLFEKMENRAGKDLWLTDPERTA